MANLKCLEDNILLLVTQLNLLELLLLMSSVKYKALQGKITNEEIKNSESQRSFIYRGWRGREEVLATLPGRCETQRSRTD